MNLSRNHLNLIRLIPSLWTLIPMNLSRNHRNLIRLIPSLWTLILRTPILMNLSRNHLNLTRLIPSLWTLILMNLSRNHLNPIPMDWRRLNLIQLNPRLPIQIPMNPIRTPQRRHRHSQSLPNKQTDTR
jgi:hypothetical protein